jgi:hypothetical protein
MDAQVIGSKKCISYIERFEGILVNQSYRKGRRDRALPRQWEF